MIVKQQSYNAAGYCRLSSEDDLSGESSSIATQRELITQYCKEHGVNLFDYYVDDGFSGTNFQRPNFERMLGDIDSGRVNLVITKDLSRFGRDYIQSGYYARQAAHCEAQFRKRLQEIDGEKSKAQMAKARRQLEANEARAGDLDRIMTSLYEDKALGRLTQERFDSMMGKYETEQKALLEQVNALREGIARTEEQRDNTARFVEYIRQYTDLQSLDAPILNQLIQRIEVHNAEKEPDTGKRKQKVSIQYKYVGIFGVITI